MRRKISAGAALTATLTLAVCSLLTLQFTARWRPAGTPAAAARTGAPSRPAADVKPYPATGKRVRVHLGVTTLNLARNSYRSWAARDLQQVNTFERDARRHADMVMWFADWEHVTNFNARQAAAVRARGSVPEISWEPWDSSKGPRVPQPRYRLARIIDGSHDEYIHRWAREIAGYGGRVRIRFAQEMNARAYPWAERTNGNRRGEFVQAWRHVRAIFKAEGATKVTWIWSPVAGRIIPGQFPGSSQVDVVGLSGFNGGSLVFRRSWRPFRVSYGPPLNYLHHLAPKIPVELSEVGSVEKGGSKAAWIRGMFREIRRRPYVHSLVWFNVRKEADWRIESSPSARRAFAEGLSRASR